MAVPAMVEERSWLGKLQAELRAAIAPVFAQAWSRLTAFAYVGALLIAGGDRRSCWQLAEQAGHATPRRMQALLGEHAWDWKAALAALQRFIVDHLGDRRAVLVLDETAELKQGQMTVGCPASMRGSPGRWRTARPWSSWPISLPAHALPAAAAGRSAGQAGRSCMAVRIGIRPGRWSG